MTDSLNIQSISQSMSQQTSQTMPQPMSQQQMKRCSMCKSMRITPTDFVRCNKQWKTCNFCSITVCKKSECDDDTDNNNRDDTTIAQCLDKFFTCFDTSNLDENDLDDYNRLKYVFESIQINQNSLVKDVIEFVNDINNCQNTD